MICRKCGKKIEGNRLFCPTCGTEQMVPEYSRIDDELIASMERLKDGAKPTKNRNDSQELQIPGTESLKIPTQPKREYVSGTTRNTRENIRREVSMVQKKEETEEYEDILEEELEEEFHLEKKNTARQKRVKLIASIAMLSVTIVVVIGVIIFLAVSSANKNSYDTQMTEAEEFWKNGQYESAIVSFQKAVEEAEDKKSESDALCKLASLYVEYGDEDSAIYYYKNALQVGQISDEDLSTLVSLYENKADINAIRELATSYGTEANKSLFEKHLLNEPVFNYKSGTYNELLTVQITAANNEQIFYTLDNTEATVNSTPYTETLQIGEGTTVVRAVALNENGLVSDEIITTYEVKLEVPSAPIITPETGSYAEATKITLHNIPTNCKAYYTIDGTVPTAESIEYTEPFDMMLGNYVVMAVCINDYTGQSSPVTMKIYDLSVGGKVSYAQASGYVMSRLQETGEVLDGDGTMPNGEKCTLLPVTVRKIGNANYYIVKRYQITDAGIKEQGTAYAVDINTGVVFCAEDNGDGQYNLSGL